jgi:hypothetical protein
VRVLVIEDELDLLQALRFTVTIPNERDDDIAEP